MFKKNIFIDLVHIVKLNLCSLPTLLGDRGGTVVKELCYKSESLWFDPRWCHRNFSLT